MKNSFILLMIALAGICVPVEGAVPQKSVPAKQSVPARPDRNNDDIVTKMKDHPEEFLQEKIQECDRGHREIRSQDVKLSRLKDSVEVKLKNATSLEKLYSEKLTIAKELYKKVKKGKETWPIEVKEIEIEEDDFEDTIADWLERHKSAQKTVAKNQKIAKKIKIREKLLKKRSRDLLSARRFLAQQLEDLKVNQVLDEDSLKEQTNSIRDILIEITEDPTSFDLDTLVPEESVERQESVEEFLNS